MDIYSVQTGDTIGMIADNYEVSVNKLIRDNELTNPNDLVPGEEVIILYPSQTYTVQKGDTLENIAASHKITVNELLRNNSFLIDKGKINQDELLTIGYNRKGEIATHGYTNTFVNRNILRKTLPYLTYLSIFNYRTSENGEVVGSKDDVDMIQLAKEYGVIPLMLMTTISARGDVDMELTFEILTNDEVQNRLFDNVIKVVKENGYYGVNISAQYITPENQSLFEKYTKNLSDRLRQEGLRVVITINPRIGTLDNGIVYEEIYFSNVTSVVDSVLFLRYRWGIKEDPPSPVISISNLSDFLDYALLQVESEKVMVGIPTLGYISDYPYVTGLSKSNSLTMESAINLARTVGATIQFDEISQTPYFIYENPGSSGDQYIVWFVNAKTIHSLLSLVQEKGLYGTCIWNIMSYYAHLWLVINSQYKIIKLLPEF